MPLARINRVVRSGSDPVTLDTQAWKDHNTNAYEVSVNAAGYNGERYGSFRLRKSDLGGYTAYGSDGQPICSEKTQSGTLRSAALLVADAARDAAKAQAAKPVFLLAAKGLPGYARPDGESLLYDWIGSKASLALYPAEGSHVDDALAAIRDYDFPKDADEERPPIKTAVFANVYDALRWLYPDDLETGVRRVSETFLGRALLANHTDLVALRAREDAVREAWLRIEESVKFLAGTDPEKINPNALTKAADLLDEIVQSV